MESALPALSAKKEEWIVPPFVQDSSLR